MENIKKAMLSLDTNMRKESQPAIFTFEEFLQRLSANPERVMRNVFQVFHDMIKNFVDQEEEEYPGDPESINFLNFDCHRLFVEDSDQPFFADRLFANRLINLVETFKRGAQQNKVFIFEGPHGCGKSTFLNNLLRKFEAYAGTPDGCRYEIVWKINRETLGGNSDQNSPGLIDKMTSMPESYYARNGEAPAAFVTNLFYTDIEIPCTSHDHPILLIPKAYRRSFLDDLLKNDEFKWRLFTDKEFNWVFKDDPCTICSSLYRALLNKLGSPLNVFKTVHARHYAINRRLGEGITVFNPGDQTTEQNVLSNPILQSQINSLFKDSNQVRYIFSRYARTNNGIYSLMDVKSHNVERFKELHNIISEGIHKVEEIEENVNSLFIAVMNPEDEKSIEDFPSFSDRVEKIQINYVLDLRTEVAIYRNIFGKHIEESFVPRVLHNFARIIISSRLSEKSEGLLEWIGDSKKYRQYCDEKLHLLKMELYTGHIPKWLSEEDLKRFTAKRRRSILAESEAEGRRGFTGRDAIKIFGTFYSTYAKGDRLITMSTLYNFFTKVRPDLAENIPPGFLESLLQLYNYNVLQEVKESLYYYNEDQIHRDIMNYMFAVNFEPGSTEKCQYTGDKLDISEEFFTSIENRLLGAKTDTAQKRFFRQDTQREYTSQTLTQELMVQGKPITETELFLKLQKRYIYNLKEKVLDPFLENENFRRAIKDYHTDDFKTYDKRIREDVTYLIKNLESKFHYTEQSAKELCMYVIDNDLAKKFSPS